MFIPRHRTDDAACHPEHTGYYQTRIRPNCAAAPIPRQRGSGRLHPLVLDMLSHGVANDAVPIARYTLDLRTGGLVIDHS